MRCGINQLLLLDWEELIRPAGKVKFTSALLPNNQFAETTKSSGTIFEIRFIRV